MISSRFQSPYSDAEVVTDHTPSFAEAARQFGRDLARSMDRRLVLAITGLDIDKQERQNVVREWLR